MLPDYLSPPVSSGLVGTAAGERSAARGHYYSGRGNRFWELLWVAGLTGYRMLIPEQDHRVLEYGVGLTDLVRDVTASTDAKLRSNQYDVPGFIAKIEAHAPTAVAFNGKTAATKDAKYLREPDPSLGPAPFTIGPSQVFVLPSSSGSNNDPARFAPRSSKDEWWEEFGRWLSRQTSTK